MEKRPPLPSIDSDLEMSLLPKESDDLKEGLVRKRRHGYHHFQKIGVRDLSEHPVLLDSWLQYHEDLENRKQQLSEKLSSTLSEKGLSEEQINNISQKCMKLTLDGDNPRPPLSCKWIEIEEHPEVSAKFEGKMSLNKHPVWEFVRRSLLFFISLIPILYAIFNAIASIIISTVVSTSAERVFWAFDAISVAMWCGVGLYSIFAAHRQMDRPAPPSILQLVPDHGAVNLYWDQPEGSEPSRKVQEYVVSCVEHPNETFTTKHRAVRVLGLRDGHSYRFRVMLRTLTGKTSYNTYFESVRLPIREGELHQIQKKGQGFFHYLKERLELVFWISAFAFLGAAIIIAVFLGDRDEWVTYFGLTICFGTPVWIRLFRVDNRKSGYISRSVKSLHRKDNALYFFILVILACQVGDWVEKAYNTSHQQYNLHMNPDIPEDVVPEWVLLSRFGLRLAFEFVVAPHTYYIGICVAVLLSTLFRRVDEMKKIILDENSDDEQIIKNVQETHKMLREEFPDILQKWATIVTFASLFWMATFLFGWVTAHNVANWNSVLLVYHVGHFGSLCLVIVMAMARVNEKAVLLPKLIHMDGPKSLPWSMQRMRARIEMRRDLSRLPLQLRVDVIAWFPRYTNIKTAFTYVITGILGALVFQENLLLFS